MQSIKRHKVLIHATTWMHHRNTALRERSHTGNTTDYMIPCQWNTFKTTETESRSIVAWAGVEDGSDYKRAGGNFGGDESILNWTALGSQRYTFIKNHQTVCSEQMDFMVCKWYLNTDTQKSFSNIYCIRGTAWGPKGDSEMTKTLSPP